jgi:hypothetical protein
MQTIEDAREFPKLAAVMVDCDHLDCSPVGAPLDGYQQWWCPECGSLFPNLWSAWEKPDSGSGTWLIPRRSSLATRLTSSPRESASEPPLPQDSSEVRGD